MIIVEGKEKKLLIESLMFDTDIKDPKLALKEFYTTVKHTLQEAEENQDLDFTSLKDRLQWFLGMLVNNKDALLHWQQSDLWKDLFKDVVIGVTDDGKTSVTVKGQQVSGSNKGMVLAYIVYVYLFTTSFNSIGEGAQKIGGAIIDRASRMVLAELAKQADLSDYSVTGDPLRVLGESVVEKAPLSNLLGSAICLLLLDPKFSSVHKSLVLIGINIVRTPISNAAGYIYTFLTKLSKLYPLKTDIVAKDIFEQFKAIGLYSKPVEDTDKNTDEESGDILNA